MSVYGTRSDTPAHQLYAQVAAESSDIGERLAILAGMAKVGQAPGRVVEVVREWLWDDYRRRQRA